MKTLALLLALTTTALAQQQPPDPALMQKAINSLITQRNNALNTQVEVEARLSQQVDENSKLKAEIEELKKKLPADK